MKDLKQCKVFNLVESKYRFVKKQQETILDKLNEEGASSEDELVLTNQKRRDKKKKKLEESWPKKLAGRKLRQIFFKSR